MAEEENEAKPMEIINSFGLSGDNKNLLQDKEQELDDTLPPCILSIAQWLKSRDFSKIPLPSSLSHRNELLLLALENVMTNNAKSKQIINEAYDNPTCTFSRIDDVLRNNPELEQFGIEEEITDAYLDQYLWYESKRRDLFPHWIKPIDSEPPPISVYKWCEGINRLEGIWDTGDAQSVVMLQTELDDPLKNMDLALLKQLLYLVLDEKIANYIIKNKDCKNQGKPCISFIAWYIGLTMDILLTANVIASPEERDSRHPILLYVRFVNEVYMLLRIGGDEAKNLISKFEEEYNPNSEDMSSYNNRRCCKKCERMRLLKNDGKILSLLTLGRSVFWDVRKRLPQSSTQMKWANSFVSVYSKDNPNLLFSMCGFEVRLLPIKRKTEVFRKTEAAWIMQEEQTKEPTAFVFLKVSDEHIKLFESNLRTILKTSASTTFIETVRQWNTAIIGIVSYFREAIINSKHLLDSFAKFESKIQESIKRRLNLKTADRLPTIIFYTPKSLGGLGMLSMCEIKIPRSNLHHSPVTTPDIRLIPELFHYIKPWKTEIMHSKLAWAEYAMRRQEAESQNRCLAVQEVEDLWDLGVPRINTVFQKQQHWKYDKGWRFRRLLTRKTPFWWTQKRHDGKLWNLVNYSPDVIKRLGGIEFILNHTLHKGTNLLTCLELSRNNTSEMQNRSFILWWSPTINQSDASSDPDAHTLKQQLDLTGIFLYQRIPVLKASYINIFKDRLWHQIHESIVTDLHHLIRSHNIGVAILKSELSVNDERKSYRMKTSCADILVYPRYEKCLHLTIPRYCTDPEDHFIILPKEIYWIDVQLCWVSCDIKSYVKSRYWDCTRKKLYPSETGLLICLDLAYFTYSAYGNWFPGTTVLLTHALDNMIKSNGLLNCLRLRVRKELQVSSNPKTSDLHVDKPLATVQRPRGQVKIGSETDWQAAATMNSKFAHRINQMHVNPVEMEEMDYSYIFPNNILEKFKRIADLRSQIAGYMFGMSSPDNPRVEQIHCIAIPPQWGTDQEVYLPCALPDHDSLKNLEPLGWIYTQSNDFDGSLPKKKFETHELILSKNRQCRVENFIIINCSVPPGACSLFAFKPSRDQITRRIVLKMVQLVLTDGFFGFYLVPESGMWNYNFKRPESEVATKYGMTSYNDIKARNDIEQMTDYKMKLGTPVAYYDMVHCPHYFFELGETAEIEEDRDDLFL